VLLSTFTVNATGFAFISAFGVALPDLANPGLRPLFLIAIVNPCEAAVYAQLRSYVSDI